MMNSATNPRCRRSLERLPLLILIAIWSAVGLSGAKADKLEDRDAQGEANADAVRTKPKKREAKAESTGGQANSTDADARAKARLRDQLEVVDDGEWAVVAERISKVEQLRGLVTAGTRARGGLGAGNKKRDAASGASTRPEQDSLRAAVVDKFPDAEIKARLVRVHEVNEQNQAKLTKAQAELRAVLTIRQEAVAVLAGLLPP